MINQKKSASIQKKSEELRKFMYEEKLRIEEELKKEKAEKEAKMKQG